MDISKALCPNAGKLLLNYVFVFQPPKSVIAQVQMQNRIPIHTISFNCNDVTANQFLCELASVTRGRFHYFNETGIDMDVPNKYEVKQKVDVLLLFYFSSSLRVCLYYKCILKLI